MVNKWDVSAPVLFCHVERSRDISNHYRREEQLEIPRLRFASLGMTGWETFSAERCLRRTIELMDSGMCGASASSRCLKIHRQAADTTFKWATPLGFEPRITPPKGAVLPLHHGVRIYDFRRRNESCNSRSDEADPPTKKQTPANTSKTRKFTQGELCGSAERRPTRRNLGRCEARIVRRSFWPAIRQ
jgi:hypothetical protein